MKINIAMAGGSCTGKSTLAAAIFARLKELGFDYDLIGEESRKLRKEFGNCRSTFDRFYLWRQQEREELRSTALDGFITDSPLFYQYTQAQWYSKEPRDKLAVRELFRMCLDIEDRYQLIVIAENPFEIPFKTDTSRGGNEQDSRRRHDLIRSFVEHFWREKLFFVKGSVAERTAMVLAKLDEMKSANGKEWPMAGEIKYPYLPEGREIKYAPMTNPFMREAFQFAKENSLDKTMPGGAVVVHDGMVIGWGANGSNYHTTHKCKRVELGCKSGEGYDLCEGCDPKNHSEAKAIASAKQIDRWIPENSDLYLWGRWWCCQPCWDKMIEAGIANVYLLERSEILFNKEHPDNIVGYQFETV